MDNNRPPSDQYGEHVAATPSPVVPLNVSKNQKAPKLAAREAITVLERLARLVIATPRRMLAGVLLVTVTAAIFGAPVSDELLGGGFQDPAAESFRAAEVLKNEFGVSDMSFVLLLKSSRGVADPTVQRVAADLERALRASPYVMNLASAWSTPPAENNPLISKDQKSGLIIAGLKGGENDAPRHAAALINELVYDREGVTVTAGGLATIYGQTNAQSERDLVVMESIALPLSFLALIWIFGGLYAALLPLVIGIFAVIGSLAILRGLTLVTEVSVFSLNLTVAMGLALAIDYSLLIISRYRDEVHRGSARDDALITAIRTAGRTVLFSALTVALAMTALILFPMYFLKSIAYAGVAIVLLSVGASLTIAPAVLILLGDRIDALDARYIVRRIRGRTSPAYKPVAENQFYRIARAVMRRPLKVGVPIVLILLTLGSPILGLKLGFGDDRTLPSSASSRQVGDEIRSNFSNDVAADITIVTFQTDTDANTEMARYAADLSRIGDVAAVSSSAGTFVGGNRVGAPSTAFPERNGEAVLVVHSTAELYAEASNAQLKALHSIPPPSGGQVAFGGEAQINRDSVDSITSRIPQVMGLTALVSIVLLFMLTGSVILPVKAVVLNVLSLSATFGALVWIFQEGHLSGLGTTATGTLTVNMLVLLFCISFGLSMDYEVFLISRIREYWLESDRTRAANDEAVALGLARTGRVVTAAALIMTISFSALIASQVSFMRMFGFGLAVAIVVDATLIRIVLLPAFMRVMGRANWWAPAILARWHARRAITD
ncbi:MMPL family transporter (plasmid) [Mycobacterium avium subsp. hominissuis]|nr:MMPL family transporter [Mycobacterium avium subsp. hominissuis]